MREAVRPQLFRAMGHCILCVAPEPTFQPERQSQPLQFGVQFIARMDMELP